MRGDGRHRRVPVSRVLASLLIAATLVACEPPERELVAATEAMQDAEDGGAAIYAPDQWAEARDALEAALREVELQSPKSRISRNYEDARQLLALAAEKARDARSAAEEKKGRVRGEARRTIDSARDGFAAVRILLGELEACPEGAVPTSALRHLTGRTENLAVELRIAQAALDDEELYTAVAYGGEVQESVDELAADLLDVKRTSDCG